MRKMGDTQTPWKYRRKGKVRNACREWSAHGGGYLHRGKGTELYGEWSRSVSEPRSSTPKGWLEGPLSLKLNIWSY